MENTEDLIGTAEAARILGTSHRTVHRLAEAGDLPRAMTVPGGFVGTYLYRRADVERIKVDRDGSKAAS